MGFLKSLKKGLGNNARELIVTAPNAIRWEKFKNLRKGIECINSDHRYWFTPYTLAKIVLETGELRLFILSQLINCLNHLAFAAIYITAFSFVTLGTGIQLYCDLNFKTS